MKTIYLFLLFVFIGSTAFPQEYNSDVEDIINEVDLESLIYYMRNLSGEDAVSVNGESVFIEHRVSNWGNDLAAEYIEEAFAALGYEPIIDTYSNGGTNVLAVKEGTEYPDEYYMICAHYDAVDYYCADDNASGTAAVLEAARLFADKEFEYSVIFALWDEEEIGLIGSNNYATAAASNGDVIHAVINMDMIAWDSDEDMVAEIHSSYEANSDDLSEYIIEVDNLYDLETVPIEQIPGTTASDHSRFWNNDYAAVLVIEEYYGGDFNPYYHTEEDRIAILNMPYFHEMSKLCIGSLASMAAPVVVSDVAEVNIQGSLQVSSFPNPFRGQATIQLTTEKDEFVKISLLNSIGSEVLVLKQERVQAGTHQLQLDGTGLTQGIYFLNISTASGIATHKMVVQ